MSRAWLIAVLVLYIIASPIALWQFQARWRGSIVEKVVTVLSPPGCLFVLFFIAGPLSIPFFWLYREKHMTVIDVDGTELEKEALFQYRSALRRERFSDRLLFCCGLRSASDLRRAATEAMAPHWDSWNARERAAKSNEKN